MDEHMSLAVISDAICIVLSRHSEDLVKLLQLPSNIDIFAKYLDPSIFSKGVKENPSYKSIEDEFCSSIKSSDNIQQLEICSSNFFQSLQEIGGFFSQNLVSTIKKEIQNKTRSEGIEFHIELKNDIQEAVRAALKNVQGQLKVSVLALHGPPGVGKTSLKRLIVGDPPLTSNQEQSTGIAESPVRAITLGKDIASKDADKFATVNDKNFIELLTGQIRSYKMQNPQVTADVEPSSTTAAVVQQSRHSSIPKINCNQQHMELPQTVAKIAELLIDKKIPPTTEFFDMSWFHIIDSGGHPQFQNVLPLLLQEVPALHIVVIRLDKKLDEKPDFVFTKGGETIPYDSTLKLTYLQIVERVCQLAKIVFTTTSKIQRVMIVGTRDDKRCQEETLEEKNEQLKLCLHEYREVLIADTIFPVNAVSDKVTERDEYGAMIAKCIAKHAPTIQAKPGMIKKSQVIPVKWMAFEIEISERSDQGVVTKGTCQQIAKSFEMTDDEMDEALKYLTKTLVHLHYPKILPELLFTTMKPIMDQLTNLIFMSFLPSTRFQGMSVLDSQDLKRKGVFYESTVQQMFEESDAVCQAFKYKEFLTLLEKLHIAVPIDEPHTYNRSERQYFFPSALPFCDDIQNELPYESHPLVFQWKYGGKKLIIPNGVFPMLIALLLKQTNICVSLAEHSTNYQSMIHLVFRGKHWEGKVHIVETNFWIEVYYSGDSSYCFEVQKIVSQSIEEVCNSKSFNFLKEHLPEKTFLCSMCSKAEPHTCSLIPRKDGKFSCSCPLHLCKPTILTDETKLCWLTKIQEGTQFAQTFLVILFFKIESAHQTELAKQKDKSIESRGINFS